MKKLVAAGAAGLVLLAGGSAVAVRSVSDSDSCNPPLTLFGSEQDASVVALEEYLSSEVAPKFKHPESLVWGSDDYSPILLPNKIAARIMVMEGAYSSSPRYYHVTLARTCQGGEWKVVEFKPVSA